MRYIPRLVQCLGELWGFSPTQTQRWWNAMEHARWSEAVALRRALLYYNGLGANEARSQHVLKVLLTPQKTLALLENLTQEGVLLRADTTMIEEHILSMITARGAWSRVEIEETVEP
jgi:hypothetical protein